MEPPEPPGAGDHPLDEEGLQLPHGRQLGEELFAEREPARLVLVGEEDLAGEEPWVRAFWQATAFPSGVRGPVERSAFCRLAPRRGEVVIRRGALYHGHCNRIQTGVGDSFAIVATSYSASDAKGHPPPLGYAAELPPRPSLSACNASAAFRCRSCSAFAATIILAHQGDF